MVTTIGKSFFLISLTIGQAQAGWFGPSLTSEEEYMAEQAKLVALTHAPQGVKVMWNSRTSGARGYSIILYDYPNTESGNCRKWYEYKVDKNGDFDERQATLCFSKDRGWAGFGGY